MNLVTFNIDDKLLGGHYQKIIKKKKNILFNHSYQQNKFFQNESKYKVAKPFNYNNDLKTSKKLKYIDKIYNSLLINLSKKLNIAHNKNFEKKYWEIIIGKWLKTFVYQMYINWETLDKIEKKYKISSFSEIILDDRFFVPNNTWHAHILTKSGIHKFNLFHHWIISKMISYKKKIKRNYLELNKNLDLRKQIFKLDKPLQYQNIFYKSMDNKIFYYLWDVPKIIKLKLMKQFKFIDIKINEKNLKLSNSNYFNRNSLFINESKKKNFLSFLNSIIKHTFPKIFLEDFINLEIAYRKVKWPKKPKYIFTTYPYYDELFKFFCAESFRSGSKIIITQHGYDNIFKYDDWFVNKMFDTQLSWGENKKRKLKNFIFTKIYQDKKKLYKFKKNNKILLILYSFNEMEDRLPDGYLDNFSINKNIFLLTKKYLNNLKKELLNKSEIKALQLTRYPILKNSIKKEFKKIKFMGLEKPFKNIIFNYNLSVFFFIGTPFFESIYLNRPTIVILEKKVHFRFDKKFNYFLKKFKENQICFDNPKDAANFINKNYEFLEDWWNLPKIQKLIDEFCELFCKRSKNLNEELKNIIKS
jgi:putative transferase (TIGR04331 family)